MRCVKLIFFLNNVATHAAHHQNVAPRQTFNSSILLHNTSETIASLTEHNFLKIKMISF